jgi:membrane protein DedA with SNARE-associated domain
MWEWFGNLTDIVLSLGYIGVYLALVVEGLGLPFPGDAVMGLYGVAAARGLFHPFPVGIVATLGYLTGSLLGYGLAKSYGAPWLGRITHWTLFHRGSMLRTTDMMDRYGPLLLVPGRFLPGIRSVSSYAAGLMGMAFGRFVIYTGMGIVLWVALWLSLGYWFGEHLQAILHWMQSSSGYIGLLMGLTALTTWGVTRLFKNGANER